jgi:hypothetical protein
MSTKPFDASLKDVVDCHPADWVRLLCPWPIRSVRVLDAETSTVTSNADKAIEVDSGPNAQWILHPEFVSGYKANFPRQLWWYNSVLHERHDLAVVSFALLLRRQADGPLMTGSHAIQAPLDAEPYNVFRYRVERLWQWPSERLLRSGLGALPLAPLTDDAAQRLPQVIEEIDGRLQTEASAGEREHLMAATALLMGLRHTKDRIRDAMKGASTMWNSVLEDSSIVQDWLEKARNEGSVAYGRRLILQLGQAKFGPAEPTVAAHIEAISDVDELDRLSLRLMSVNNWQELLGQ